MDLLTLKERDSASDIVKSRLKKNEYTKLGSQVLFADQLNDKNDHSEFVEAYKDSLNSWKEDAHPYQLVNSAYFKLRRLARDQTIAYFSIGGELKNEMITHLGAIMGHKRDIKYCKKVIAAIKLHELMTSTMVNDQMQLKSGVIIQAQINERGHLNGFRTTSTLFDYHLLSAKVTVRNFNIFYSLLNGPADLLKSLQLDNTFNYLNGHKSTDSDKFSGMDEHLTLLNLNAASKTHFYSVLSAILHFGNVQFNETQPNEPNEPSSLLILASLLQVEVSALKDALTVKTCIVNGEFQSQILSMEECYTHCNLLASQLYAMTHAWLIDHSNKRTTADEYANSILFVNLKPVTPNKDGSVVDFLNNQSFQDFTSLCCKSLFPTFKQPESNQVLHFLSHSNTPADFLSSIRENNVYSKSQQHFTISHSMDVTYNATYFLQMDQECLANDLVVLCSDSLHPLLNKLFASKSIKSLSTKQSNILIPHKSKTLCKSTKYMAACDTLFNIVSHTMIHIVTNEYESYMQSVNPTIIELTGHQYTLKYNKLPKKDPISLNFQEFVKLESELRYAPDSEEDMQSVAESVPESVVETVVEDLVDPKLYQQKTPKKQMSKDRKKWLCLVYGLTCCIPSFCLCRMTSKIRLAWREKLTLCLIIFFLSLITLFFVLGLGPLICPLQNIYSPFEIMDSDKSVFVLYNRVYPLDTLQTILPHTLNKVGLKMLYNNNDLTPVAQTYRPSSLWCPNQFVNTNKVNVTRFQQLHRRWDGPLGNSFINLLLTKPYVKQLAFPIQYVKSAKMVIVNDYVYDLQQIPKFESSIIAILQSQMGTDLSSNSQFMSKWPQLKNCFNNVLMRGIVDKRQSIPCYISNSLFLSTSILLVIMVGLKFIAALRSSYQSHPERVDKFCVIQIPCYSENKDSLLKTINSCTIANYSDKHKLLFVVCDGIVSGHLNDASTPDFIKEIFGIDTDPKNAAIPLSYCAIGQGSQQHNMAQVYSGLYELQGHLVPFVVVVKCGQPRERIKPGNRGKRDSQMLLMQFFNKVIYNTPMSPLELELYHHIKHVIGVEPIDYEFVLMVDADTTIDKQSVTPLISGMQHDSSVMGCCGETRISNQQQSFTTMIQVYEYYISHHLSKAFESMFGSVTCLPGCFCMYRLHLNKKPFLVSNTILSVYGSTNTDTLHLKNLLSLGEDRYLTTMMLKHYSQLKMVFISNSWCTTVVPHNMSVLKSQRRRWINSTVHNLYELLQVELCGCCCFSMRFMVMVDLFSTVVGPIGVLYLFYLVGTVLYNLYMQSEVLFPMISLALICAIYGLQMIVFVIKKDFQQIGWLLLYILAIPLFHVYLPLYSFWHFDDFTWGNTRVILGENGKVQVKEQDEDYFDPQSIPHVKWEEFSRQHQQQLPIRASWYVEEPHAITINNSKVNRMSQLYTTPTKRSPYNDIPNEEVKKSIQIIIKNNEELTKKQILLMLQKEYNVDFWMFPWVFCF